MTPSADFEERFNARSLLVYTGIPRLAKDLLDSVIFRCGSVGSFCAFQTVFLCVCVARLPAVCQLSDERWFEPALRYTGIPHLAKDLLDSVIFRCGSVGSFCAFSTVFLRV